MKCLVVDVTIQEKEGINTCWVTMTKLAQWKEEKQKVYHFKKSDILLLAAVDKTKNLINYEKFSVLVPGTIVNVEQGANDYGNLIVKDINIYKEPGYTFDELFKN